MERWAVVGVILLLSVTMISFVFARDIAATVSIPDIPQQQLLAGKSVAYYLKVLNANLVSGANASTASLNAQGVTNTVANQDNGCKTPTVSGSVCPTGLKGKISKNLDVVELDGKKVFMATIPASSSDKTTYIGQYFTLDLSKLDIDYSEGLSINIQKHPEYTFTLDSISSNGRFMFFKVTKPGNQSLNCQNVLSGNTAYNEFSSQWKSITKDGWNNLWKLPIIANPATGPLTVLFYNANATTGSYNPLNSPLFAYTLKLDLSTEVNNRDCYDDEAPKPNASREPVLKITFVKREMPSAGQPMKLYFTIDVLKSQTNKEYYKTLPAAAEEYFK